jgi:alkaline phosphatase D
VQAALQAYDEWMPVRTVSLDKLARQRRSYRLGDLAELFMLEERLTSRSQQLPATIPSPFGLVFTQTGDFLDPSRTLLGLDGEQRLVRQLRKSDARWKLLGQGVMMAQLKAQGAPNSQGGGAFLNSDQWDGYQPARDRLFQAVSGADGKPAIGNLVVLTGDIHSSWAADLTPDPNNPDLATGGYDAATGQGALAVEFVGTSVTSPGVDDPDGQTAGYLKSQNPHFKYVDLNRRGYMLLDLTPQRVVCEWWHLDTVAQVDGNQHLAVAYQVLSGQPHLQPASQTAAKTRPAAPAP